MNYYFNELDPVSFQRLINAILVARFGEDFRVTPLRGADGGRDGETAPGNPYFEVQVDKIVAPDRKAFSPPRQGRYLFQVKHHRTVDAGLSEARAVVLGDFEREMMKNVINRSGDAAVNYFFLITNVSSSREVLSRLDRSRKVLLKNRPNLHADIWWQDQIIAYLDQIPQLWSAFPAMFAGGKSPVLAELFKQTTEGLPRALQMALDREYKRDSSIKFQQIELEKDLSKLFVDLNIDTRNSQGSYLLFRDERGDDVLSDPAVNQQLRNYGYHHPYSALGILLSESGVTPNRIILEGGPGQGKSTLTQMMVQIYRQQLLPGANIDPENRWIPPRKIRLPFRLELRRFAEWLSKNLEGSIEEYLANSIKQNSGGSPFHVGDLHSIVEYSPTLIVFDGLDEIGSDDLRDHIIEKINECVDRFEAVLKSDVRVIITTRPPAIVGRREKLSNYTAFSIAPMEPERIKEYVTRWLSAQAQDHEQMERIKASFWRRQGEPHVQALIKNPMQLSVLLHFIRLKGEAFPDRRAELYRDYFQTVIDRDVEKSSELLQHRTLIESLHQFLGYKIHALTEAQQADGTLSREVLLKLVEGWLEECGNEPKMARQLFKLGEERLGLIITLRGEGEEARYGYEIQPIREYFAAAFINGQIRGNAHDVFQAMVRRVFWREVALFLAGLRRPNEKADLVARSKALDNDEELGWRQDGRALTQQLLLEGVYSEPKHVFNDALSYVLELLDPAKVPVQNQPKDMLSSLPLIIKQSTNKQHQEYLLKLLEEYNYSDDQHILFRLYWICLGIIEKSKIIEKILKLPNKSASLAAQARLNLPYLREVDISGFVSSQSYWEGVPDYVLARLWWQTAIQINSSINLPAPPRFHQLLIELYATSPLHSPSPFGKELYSEQTIKSSTPTWAVWKLAAYHEFLVNSTYSRRYRITAIPNIPNVVEKLLNTSDLSFEGLDDNLSELVSVLIDVARHVVVNLVNEQKRSIKLLDASILPIRNSLMRAGLSGWLTSRFVGAIFSVILSSTPSDLEMSYLSQIDIFGEGVERNEWIRILSLIKGFYEESNKGQKTSYSNLAGEVPKNIRLEDNGELIPFINLLKAHLVYGNAVQFDWIKRMTYSYEIIRPLIEICRDDLEKLLIKIADLEIVDFTSASPLLSQDMQKILRIVRKTSSPEILSGALIVLSGSNYIRLAGSATILKMLSADIHDKSKTDIFRAYSPRNNSNDKEKDIGKHLLEIANGILESPSQYSFRIVSEAATYFAENFPVKAAPLLLSESELAICV